MMDNVALVVDDVDLLLAGVVRVTNILAGQRRNQGVAVQSEGGVEPSGADPSAPYDVLVHNVKSQKMDSGRTVASITTYTLDPSHAYPRPRLLRSTLRNTEGVIARHLGISVVFSA
jgi:hypothetical protein